MSGVSVAYLLYVRHLGGILAVANIRGGGEYGLNWYKGEAIAQKERLCLTLALANIPSPGLLPSVFAAGSLGNKQNCFDDFQCAAEYLVQERYTAPSRIAINGASNGGLLVGRYRFECAGGVEGGDH